MLGHLQNHKGSKRADFEGPFQKPGLDSIKRHFPKSFARGRYSGSEKKDVRPRSLVREMKMMSGMLYRDIG